ncbi:cell division protein FtsQ/DivIB [Mordavella massiliensis]|jgi:cell division protein FtsQ|uniref:FtsQ-type POTRA domain-containing protein n=1 Tax=Mordavella massiliensis TaxID=1871024 RepID=A0A938X1T1_9CLOT|nr:FtsQ-type POTRA domain-containing protein [Mordavella massiliensis]MBM6826034.1 FtsQ-type POTRA domain-containing protein [Mordavella massiliensis]MBM6971346.1 FtsQ-type POTRA domain-containing protein [Mordavella massiliensis]
MGKKKTKRKSHRLYAFVVLLLAAAILVLSVLVLFYVQQIKVEGNEYCTDQQIVDTVRSDKYSINTLYIAGKYAIGKGKSLPCLESIHVSLSAPWTLKVTVREKPIVGYLENKDNYAYFDKEGMVVSMSPTLIEGLPCIEGVSMKDIKLYSRLETDDSKIFEEILETSQEAVKQKISADRIVCRGDEIYLDIGKIYVNLGNQVSSDQIAQIPPILEKLGGQEGTLHLENYSESSDTITFDIGEIPQ